MDNQTIPELELPLPGFRFHPTEEELLNCYLRKIATGKRLGLDIIRFLNIYHHEPWELPGLTNIGEREWYFFVPRDRRHGHGGRPNRTTQKGFWKATGSDRQIRCSSDPKNILGVRKTLVFYTGRAPRGFKTDWVMNEYRLPDDFSFPKEDIVLCKIYRKATSLKVLEQRAAMEVEERSRMTSHNPNPSSSPPSHDITLSSSCDPYDQESFAAPNATPQDIVFKTEEEEGEVNEKKVSSSLVQCGFVKEKLTELEVPKFSMDLTMDPLWSLLRSPWLDNCSPCANLLNF